jgi:hypothetical protein
MRWFLAVLLCTLSVTLTPAARAADEGKEKGITGVKGKFIRIEKNRETADKVEKLKVEAGTRIEVEWTYPIAPPLPTAAEGKSSDDAVVKPGAVESVTVVPQLIGVGRLGAFFVAEKKGSATLTFAIKSGDARVILKVEVEVE